MRSRQVAGQHEFHDLVVGLANLADDNKCGEHKHRRHAIQRRKQCQLKFARLGDGDLLDEQGRQPPQREDNQRQMQKLIARGFQQGIAGDGRQLTGHQSTSKLAMQNDIVVHLSLQISHIDLV